MGENLARVTTIGGAFGFSLLLSACNATAPLDIPEVGEAPTLSTVSIDFAPAATFALTKIVADIKRGEVLGAFPSHGIERSEAHTSELQALMRTPYAVFCLKKQIHQKHY